MLIGIIREETNNDDYYIHLENKDNIKEVYIVHANNNILEVLKRDKTKDLIKTLLSSKLTYKEKENDYDIYLDEANNKRYFKDGIENYFKFFENNGINAINYLGNTNNKNTPKWYKIAVNNLVFTILASSIILTPFTNDTKFYDGPKYLISSTVELTSKEMTNLIKLSPYVDKETGAYLANKDYFDFVAKYSNDNNSRKYVLRKKLDHLTVRHYKWEEFPDTLGYYNIERINTINILETQKDDENRHRDILTHEFIHLTQTQNKYCYIIESCAEILEYEFYNQPINDYYELIKRTKVLMEIIGPQPVIECNFKGDTKSFEKAIKEYLNEEDATKLLELLSTADIHDEKKQGDVNNGIDNLLAKMYYNKTGKNIKDDKMINEIYHSNTPKRIYFNTTLKEYNEDYRLSDKMELIDELDLNDVINSKETVAYTYVEKRKLKNNTYSLPMRKKDFASIPNAKDKTIEVTFNDGTIGKISFNKEKMQWNKVEHYKFIKQYEPAISKKFPNQDIKSVSNNNEIDEMLQETQNETTDQKTM